MKHSLLALVLVAPALMMADERPAIVCARPMTLISPRQEQEALVHSLSVAAEAVAAGRDFVWAGRRTLIPPRKDREALVHSLSVAAGPVAASRHRAVAPPQGGTP